MKETGLYLTKKTLSMITFQLIGIKQQADEKDIDISLLNIF